MPMFDPARPARDREPMSASDGDQDWLVAWHPPSPQPVGAMHGSTAICVVTGGLVLLVRSGAGGWSLPGGRPEPGEGWEDTLRREVFEEACAEVTRASLLGFGRGECLRGHEAGRVLVRALWRADVDLWPWEPSWEMDERRLFPPADALGLVREHLPGGHKRMMTRLFMEAGLLPRGPGSAA